MPQDGARDFAYPIKMALQTLLLLAATAGAVEIDAAKPSPTPLAPIVLPRPEAGAFPLIDEAGVVKDALRTLPDQTAALEQVVPQAQVEAAQTVAAQAPQPVSMPSQAAAPRTASRQEQTASAQGTLSAAVENNVSGEILYDHERALPEGASAVSADNGETVPFRDVMVGVYDADDNLWLNANGVWVFKKGTDHREKVRIPSEEFAHVRQTVGKSGRYADYEYWGDQAQGSFWEFYDQPGRNVLLENLQRMVRDHRPEQWQGKSWKAFRAMLKANPKGVHILSASGVSRKNFLAGLRFLKDQGFLDALPPEQNIQCVGNPEHPFYASTDSPSKAKLLTMKRLILDPAQKAAELLKAAGKKPPLILGPDGVTRENLMPVGFSDDDPGNIATMRDGAFDASGKLVEKGIAAEIAGGAWPDVKFSLFDSDPEDPKAVNVVIKRDGTTRVRTAEDDAEMGSVAATRRARASYHALLDDGFQRLALREIAREARRLGQPIWSARLATGLLGLPQCLPGNKGPKNAREIVLAIGSLALAKLIEMGFIPCPSCKPGEMPGFWDAVAASVRRLYGIGSLADFVDKTVLPFDARRLDWERIVPVIGGFPSRLYVPKGLGPAELAQLRTRLSRLSPDLPAVGYYDPDSPGRFHEYGY